MTNLLPLNDPLDKAVVAALADLPSAAKGDRLVTPSSTGAREAREWVETEGAGLAAKDDIQRRLRAVIRERAYWAREADRLREALEATWALKSGDSPFSAEERQAAAATHRTVKKALAALHAKWKQDEVPTLWEVANEIEDAHWAAKETA